VQLQTASGPWSYRLVVHPRTHGSARDHQGRCSYLSVDRVAVPTPDRPRPSCRHD